MKFGEIVDHLVNRGFVTRIKWCREFENPEALGMPKTVIVFGMDNVGWMQDVNGGSRIWTPCLDDMWADDWIELPFFWNGSKDDFLPINHGFHPNFYQSNSECKEMSGPSGSIGPSCDI